MGKSKKGISDRVRKAKQAKASNVFKVQSNPFEVKINKQKHKILGRKTKHDRGLPGVSRSKANKKRNETLLKEYKDRHRDNSIVDERFGENNADLSVEEKMLQRFAIEKKRKHNKMSLFNLNDDEEELTHFGQSLADIEDFGNDDMSDEDDSGVISGEYVSEAHFGGGIFTKVKSSNDDNETGKMDEDRPKSRKEIMDEIIMKSKRAKLEKQNDKDEAENLREKLDGTWKEVEELLKSSTRTTRDREAARQMSEPDSYDLAVKQMQYDRKAAPAVREKTKAEKAAEEAAKMRRQEEERLNRMRDCNDVEAQNNHRSADDLNYDFIPEKVQVDPVVYKDGVMMSIEQSDEKEDDIENDWLLEPALDDDDDGIKEANNSESGEASDVEDGDSNGDSDDSYSDIDSGEDVENPEDPSDAESDCEKKVAERKKKSNYKIKKATKKSLEFPENYEEFLTYRDVQHYEDSEKCICALHSQFSSGLAKGNKGKLQKLFQFLWQLMYDLHMEEPPNIAESDKLLRHLYELCEIDPSACAKYINLQLKDSYNKYLTNSDRISLPDFGTMMQFKLVKILFSTSDFIHPVAGPAMIFMCHVIHTCRPTNLRDIAHCLFLCNLVYDYVSFSKRFVPECLNFLCAVICMAVPKKTQQTKGVPAAASMYLSNRNCDMLVLMEKREKYDSKTKPNLVNLLTTANPESLNKDGIRIQLLSLTLRLSLQYTRLYSQLPCFKEIFEPLKAACTRCLSGFRESGSKAYNHPLAELLHELQSEIQRLIKKRPSLVPLVHTESNKPKFLPLYDPKFEEVCEPFQKNSRKNISSTKREKERLQHKYKRELKGAMREIKKDARFLAKEQLNEQIQKDEERAAKVKRLFGFLSNQEGEVKKINRKTFKLGMS